MGIHYLDSGRPVRTNHILNPDFEVDASYWRPLNANSTIEVVTGHQFHGGKALKITGNGSDFNDRYGATYDGPGILINDVLAPEGGTPGEVAIVASMSTDSAPTVVAYMGVFVEDAVGTVLTGGSKYVGGVTSTSRREMMQPASYTGWGFLEGTHYIRPQISFEYGSAGVYYIDAIQVLAGYWEGYGSPGWPIFISGNRTDGEDGLNYAWTGTPHASTSTGTATRWVDIPETGDIGETFTITGDDFAPDEVVRIWVMPELADNSSWDTSANPDGTFEFSFTMPPHTGGTTTVQVSAGSVWMSQPYAQQEVTIPVPPPLEAPETTATQKVNYFLDPRLQVIDGENILARNYCHNPSPTDSLDGYAAVGTATIELDPTSSIKGAGGIKVTSPDAVSGIEVFPQENLNDTDVTFTVYIRAREAMTITASVDSLYAQWTEYMVPGWGDYGWGEPYSFVKDWSHTFEAGEVKRFRVKTDTKTGTGNYPNDGSPVGQSLLLKGDGVFDVDGVWHGSGVDDGVDPDEGPFPGGEWDIPNAPLYFDGDTPDDDTYTYEWTGTPRASTSVRKGKRLKYLRSSSGYMDPTMEMTYAIEFEGEPAAAVQSSWDDSSADDTFFTADGPADGVGEDLKYLGLVEGKHYALSFDIHSVMENYIEGYIGGVWDQLYVEGPETYVGIPFPHPFDRRITIPFTAGSGAAEVSASIYRNWYTGYHVIANVALVEIDFRMPQFSDVEAGVAGTLDILALGAVPGGAYTAIVDTPPAEEGDYYRAEYQIGAGSWTTIEEVLYDAANVSESREWTFTIPEEATGARLAWLNGNGWATLDCFSVPIPFFDGDTAAGDGYYYEWFGTPGESASLRIEGDPPVEGGTLYAAARVWVDDGFGPFEQNVGEIRVVVGGELLPVTDFRRP